MLFSEPKISQLAIEKMAKDYLEKVSVLFSEPKISQLNNNRAKEKRTPPFQCSSASRKFLNRTDGSVGSPVPRVSVLFSEPKISQCCRSSSFITTSQVSVLFSEPKISQSTSGRRTSKSGFRFSALQRAENFSIGVSAVHLVLSDHVSVLFSEPKISQSRPSHLHPSIFPTAMITLRRS